MASDAWYFDHKLVAALRIDHQGTIIDATPGLGTMLGTALDALSQLTLAEFCDHYLGGSIDADALLTLAADDDAGVGAQCVDADARPRHVRVYAGSPDIDGRTLLFTDTTALSSAQDHLVRRMAHDRLMHILVSDLLDGSTRQPHQVVHDVLTGFAEYFGFVTTALTQSGTGAPDIVAYVSSVGCERGQFDRLSSELHLLEPHEVDQLLHVLGPGDVWHVALTLDDSFALGIEHSSLTCLQVTVPYDDDIEMSFVATLGGKVFPRKADLELVHKALSHMAQFLRRAAAEDRIRRHGALDEALASARAQLLNAEQPTLLQALKLPIERIAAITTSTSVDLLPIALVDPQLTRAFEGWTAPRPVSPERLGRAATVQDTWAVPIRDGQGPIALLTYAIGDHRNEAETAKAWERLAELVPGTSAKLDAERRLEAAFHSTPVGIALRDSAGKLIDCNEAFVRFVGAPKAAALVGSGRFEHVDLAACEPALRDRLNEDTVFERDELPFRHSDSHIVWGRITTTRVDDGMATVLLDHVEDVTITRATQAALATERRRDALTGLPNRSEIEARLAARLAHGEPVTVTAVNLDHFSAVNASLGHIAGDRLLQLVAERLLLTVGPRAELGRVGGDEFVVVAATASQQLGRDLADRILTSLRQPFAIDGSDILTGASIGLCVGRGETSASELLVAATEALTEAKLAGRNRIVHYQSKGDRRRVGLFESELRRAVHERSLDVFYQPEFDIETRMIVGAEALVRWHHPTEGLLSAGAFVPVIEEIGLSTELCDYVLHEACATAAEWHRTLPTNPFMIRANLSPRDIEQPDIVDRVMRTLDATGLDVKWLCLEVTETAVMRDQRRVISHLQQFAELGVSLAIDDFGTGFSSLWLLRELPFDTLKIDQAFIKALDSGQPQDRAIVETIVNLGHTLGMEVTAEGVETESQFAALAAIGIKRAQGFLLARPAPKAALVERLNRRVPVPV